MERMITERMVFYLGSRGIYHLIRVVSGEERNYGPHYMFGNRC